MSYPSRFLQLGSGGKNKNRIKRKSKMTDNAGLTNGEPSEHLYSILKDCVHHSSFDSMTDDFDYGATVQEFTSFDCFKMVSMPVQYGDEILEENGRISLAYENLRVIPRRVAEKYASKTKFLDLGYNNFRNLMFLSYFDRLHTLILDRNPDLDVKSLPFLPSLRILWINNCDINRTDEWLHRIHDYCPNLRQLSMMGNPATLEALQNDTYSTYREHIFGMFPRLEYLDGVSRDASDADWVQDPPKSSTPDSMRSNGSSSSGRKKSLTIKIAEMFQFKHRKRSNFSLAN